MLHVMAHAKLRPQAATYCYHVVEDGTPPGRFVTGECWAVATAFAAARALPGEPLHIGWHRRR